MSSRVCLLMPPAVEAEDTACGRISPPPRPRLGTQGPPCIVGLFPHGVQLCGASRVGEPRPSHRPTEAQPSWTPMHLGCGFLTFCHALGFPLVPPGPQADPGEEELCAAESACPQGHSHRAGTMGWGVWGAWPHDQGHSQEGRAREVVPIGEGAGWGLHLVLSCVSK